MKRLGAFSWAKTGDGALRGEIGTETQNIIKGVPALMAALDSQNDVVPVDVSTIQESSQVAPAIINFESVEGVWNTQPAKLKATVNVIAPADQTYWPGQYICTAHYAIVQVQTGAILAVADFSSEPHRITWTP